MITVVERNQELDGKRAIQAQRKAELQRAPTIQDAELHRYASVLQDAFTERQDALLFKGATRPMSRRERDAILQRIGLSAP